MKELDKKDADIAEEKRKDGQYIIPDEASCSAEFPKGCIFNEDN